MDVKQKRFIYVCIFYFLSYSSMPFIYGYIQTFLTEMGHTVMERSYVISIGAITAIVLQFFVGYLCDRYQSNRKFFILGQAILIAVSWFFYHLTSQPFYQYIFFGAIMGGFYRTVISIQDAWILELDDSYKVNFGSLRAFGSFGWAVGCPIAGVVILHFGYTMLGNIFLIMGIIMDFGVPAAPINGIYVGMGGMMMVQLICSVSVSTMVQSSNYKRQMQTSVPSIVCGVYLLLANTFSIIVKFLGMKMLEWDLSVIANGIIFNAVFTVIMVLYMGGALKAFWPATICFMIVYFSYYSLSSAFNFMEADVPLLVSIELAIVISYAMIITAIILMYLIFVAMYKRDFSKQNFETQLKRAK